jgi:molybdenum cofactor guanylyltransferase
MISDCTAIIMAGGDSRRMGRDKAGLQLGEQTLIEHVASALKPVFRTVQVSVRRHRPDIDLPQIGDLVPDGGPLAGLCAALAQVASAGTEATAWIFLVATDMPFLQSRLIERLAQERDGFDAVVPVVGGHPQPLAAFYSTSVLCTLQGVLGGEGKRSLRAALERLNVCYVDQSRLQESDPGLRSFIDLDTPQELDRARQELSA